MNGRINGRIILFVVMGILGAFSALTNLWLLLLVGTDGVEGTRPLLFTGLGILIVVAAVLQIRRELKDRSR